VAVGPDRLASQAAKGVRLSVRRCIRIGSRCGKAHIDWVGCERELAPLVEFPNLDGVSAVLYTLAVVLIVLWLVGYLTSYTMGGLLHILLVIAIIVVLVRLISGRKPV